MPNRWYILALLFAVRLSMAFQFQSVASISPALAARYGVGLAEVGFLIGLYLTPGVVFAIPGAEIGRRFGDKRVVLFGLILMIVGGLIMSFAPTWPSQIAGRIIAGAGGVLLNVLLSKIVADCFEGREIATAMAIFVNSWPAGIALNLMVMPVIVAKSSVTFGFLVCVAFCVAALAALALLYRSPDRGAVAVAAKAEWPSAIPMQAVIVAGCIWGLFNAAIGMVFGFAIAMLTERGWALISAGSATSVVLWMVTLSVPIGGILADRTGRPIEVMLGGFALFAIALVAATRTDFVFAAFVAVGLFGGLSAGSIMSLPARVLTAQTRAAGMGVYFAMFYAIVFLAPIVAGLLAQRTGAATIAFDFGAAMLVACFPAYFLFRRLADRIAFAER